MQLSCAIVTITYAKFTLHDFRPIFFTRRQVLINRRQMPEIGGKSVLVHASDNRAVWIIKDAIWGNRRCVADAREIFGMLTIWSCRRFTILLCEWVLTEKYIGDDLQLMRKQDTGQREVRGGLFFFFYKAINVSHLQTTCLHFCIRIYRIGRLHEDEEGARVFPINNILI